MWSWLRSRRSADVVEMTVADAAARRIDEDVDTSIDPDARLAYVRALFRITDRSPVTATASEKRCLAELESLTRRGAIVELVPRFSGTLPKLLASLRDSPPASVLAQQVAADPQLLSGVMSVANSPAFRTREKEIEDIEQAVVLLGSRHLREVIASVTFRPILCIDSVALVDASMARSLWEHAIECAGECRQLGEGAEGFAFYLCGMTQAVGLSAVLRYVSEHRAGLDETLSAGFAEGIARLYPKMSSVLAKGWHLPSQTGVLLDGLADEDGPNETTDAINRVILDFLTRTMTDAATGQVATG